jgi:hypothetical protein
MPLNIPGPTDPMTTPPNPHSLDPEEREDYLVEVYDFSPEEASAWVHTTYGTAEQIRDWRQLRPYRVARNIYNWFPDEFDHWMRADVGAPLIKAAYETGASRHDVVKIAATGRDLGLTDDDVASCIRAGYNSDELTLNFHKAGFIRTAEFMAGMKGTHG